MAQHHCFEVKRYLSIFILAGLFIRLNAQTGFDSPDANDKVFTFVDQDPQFPGGMGALLKFIQEHIVYPQMERDNGIGGKVIVRFVVDEKGKVTNVTVRQAVSPGLDKEAVRVVKMLPEFQPGLEHGKPVPVYYNLPVLFKAESRDITIINQLLNKYGSNKLVLSGIKHYNENDPVPAIQYFKRAGKRTRNGIFFAMIAECYKKLGDMTDRCNSLDKAIALGYTPALDTYKNECVKLK